MSKVNVKRLNELLEKAKQKNKLKSPSNAKNKPIKGNPKAMPMTSFKGLWTRNHSIFGKQQAENEYLNHRVATVRILLKKR